MTGAPVIFVEKDPALKRLTGRAFANEVLGSADADPSANLSCGCQP